MDSATGADNHPSWSPLPYEVIGLIAFHLSNPNNLALFSLVSRAFHWETIPHLYTNISFAAAAQQPKYEWARSLVLWARTIRSNRILASRVHKLILHLPDLELPALFRQILCALQSCVNLQDLQLHHPPHRTPFQWLLPSKPSFGLVNFTTDISAFGHLGLFLESQSSIRTLRLEAFDMRLSLQPGSLPQLMHYTGFTTLISAARIPGTVWENLVHAELRDAYRWEKGLLDTMPHLRTLDITVAAGGGDLLTRIAEKCKELRSLVIRDGNGLLHDRREFADGRLSGVAVLPEFASSFARFRHLSALTLDPVYRSRLYAPASTELKHLIAWNTHCPTLHHFTSPTGRQWLFVPSAPSLPTSADVPQYSGHWNIVFEPDPRESSFATDAGLFGMRRVGEIRERSDGGSVDELIAIIERLNRERGAD